MIQYAQFYKLVRYYAVNAKAWDSRRIIYQTLPDERFDLTLVSQRVYGNRDEYLTIMAAAGLDRINQELKEQILILPDQSLLLQIKEQAGISTGAN